MELIPSYSLEENCEFDFVIVSKPRKFLEDINNERSVNRFEFFYRESCHKRFEKNKFFESAWQKVLQELKLKQIKMAFDVLLQFKFQRFKLRV